MNVKHPLDAKKRPIVPSSRCDWNDHGNSCPYPGILSRCTNGAGPWYCREHWCKLNDYPDMEKEGLHGNQLPQTPLHSFAAEEIRAKIDAKRKPGEDRDA